MMKTQQNFDYGIQVLLSVSLVIGIFVDTFKLSMLYRLMLQHRNDLIKVCQK